jgi:hypothetical protein
MFELGQKVRVSQNNIGDSDSQSYVGCVGMIKHISNDGGYIGVLFDNEEWCAWFLTSELDLITWRS